MKLWKNSKFWTKRNAISSIPEDITRVNPDNGGRGGGREYMTGDAVEVEIVNVQPYR